MYAQEWYNFAYFADCTHLPVITWLVVVNQRYRSSYRGTSLIGKELRVIINWTALIAAGIYHTAFRASILL